MSHLKMEKKPIKPQTLKPLDWGKNSEFRGIFKMFKD